MSKRVDMPNYFGLIDAVREKISGNSVIRKYDVGREIFQIGPDNLWSAYSATCRKTHNKATLFILRKTKLQRINENYREEIIQAIIHGVRVLETVRHSSVLRILTPICESNDSIAFASESVISKLNYSSMDTIDKLIAFEQILESIKYIHSTFKMVIGPILLNCLALDSNNDLKICFLFFLRSPFNIDNKLIKFQSAFAFHDFCAPETWTCQCDYRSDTFNACAIALYLFNTEDEQFCSLYTSKDNNKKLLKYLQDDHSKYYKNIPSQLLQDIFISLSIEPENRPDLKRLLENPVFKTIEIVLVRTMTNFEIMSNIERSEFFKLFNSVIDKISTKILEQRIIPFLIDKLDKFDLQLNSFQTLMNSLQIIDSSQLYSTSFDSLAHLFDIKDNELCYNLLNHLEVFVNKIPIEKVKPRLLSLIIFSLTNTDIQLKIKCLSSLQQIIDHEIISQLAIKIYNPIKECLISSSNIPSNYSNQIQVISIIILSKMLQFIKTQSEINNLLVTITKLEVHSPGLAMAILGFVQIMIMQFKLLNTSDLVNTVLPSLIKNSYNVTMNTDQINSYFKVIKCIITIIHTKLLENLKQSTQNTHLLKSTVNDCAEDKLNIPSKCDINNQNKITSTNKNLIDLINLTDLSLSNTQQSKTLNSESTQRYNLNDTRLFTSATTPLKQSNSVISNYTVNQLSNNFQHKPQTFQTCNNNIRIDQPKSYISPSNVNYDILDQFRDCYQDTSYVQSQSQPLNIRDNIPKNEEKSEDYFKFLM